MNKGQKNKHITPILIVIDSNTHVPKLGTNGSSNIHGSSSRAMRNEKLKGKIDEQRMVVVANEKKNSLASTL